MLERISLAERLTRFSDQWSPKVIATVNDMDVKVVKVQGEFVWHHHAEEDELFLVIKGELDIQLRDGVVTLGPGECVVVPKGLEHRPVAREEVHLLLLERATIQHTGGVDDPRRVERFERI